MFKFKFNSLYFNIGFQRKPEKHLYLETNGNMKLRNMNCSTAFFHCSHFKHVIHISSHIFHMFGIIFPCRYVGRGTPFEKTFKMDSMIPRVPESPCTVGSWIHGHLIKPPNYSKLYFKHFLRYLDP